MNNYPKYWDKTVTIYNQIKNESTGAITWQSTSLSGCFWKYINNVTYVNRVKMETKEVICRIPKSDKYLSLEEWISKTPEEGEFTLRNGDIVVLGEVTDVVDEYTKGSRSTDLLNKYRSVNRAFQIESFTDDTGELLCAEHYHLKGI